MKRISAWKVFYIEPNDCVTKRDHMYMQLHLICGILYSNVQQLDRTKDKTKFSTTENNYDIQIAEIPEQSQRIRPKCQQYPYFDMYFAGNIRSVLSSSTGCCAMFINRWCSACRWDSSSSPVAMAREFGRSERIAGKRHTSAIMSSSWTFCKTLIWNLVLTFKAYRVSLYKSKEIYVWR